MQNNSAKRDGISLPKREHGQKFMTSFTLGDKLPSYSTVNNLVARIRTRHLSIEDEEHSGRPTQVIIPENIKAIHSIILND
jgi:hypothetical protein